MKEDKTESVKIAESKESAAEATHEINNFLTGILGQAQLLRREELNPTARRRVDTIEQLANRIKDSLAKISSV